MRFSLVLCTLNREKEIKVFIDSLIEQTFKDFELIIVDQNKDDKVKNIFEKYQKNLTIKYIHSFEIGLSKSRNLGLNYTKGSIVCFPDDDCFYPKELLENINRFFLENNYDFLMGKTIDKESGKIVAGKDKIRSQIISPYEFLGSSTTFFLKNNFNERFDENFGLGAIFNSGEEEEFVFRLLKNGYKGYYEPELNYVYHPALDIDFTNLTRVKERSIGLGAFIAKHFFTKEGVFFFFKFNIIRPLFAMIIYFFKRDICKSKYYFYRFLGIWKGFIKYFRLKDETFN